MHTIDTFKHSLADKQAATLSLSNTKYGIHSPIRSFLVQHVMMNHFSFISLLALCNFFSLPFAFPLQHKYFFTLLPVVRITNRSTNLLPLYPPRDTLQNIHQIVHRTCISSFIIASPNPITFTQTISQTFFCPNTPLFTTANNTGRIIISSIKLSRAQNHQSEDAMRCEECVQTRCWISTE